MKISQQHVRDIGVIGGIIAAIFLVSYFLEPKQIVEQIGVGNSYLVAFVLAFLGGVSTFTAGSFYVALATLAVGGLHPVLLGLAAGPGLFLGDLLFFYFGTKLEHTIPERYKRPAHKLAHLIEVRYQRFSQLVIYVYAGFTPLPGDVLMLALAIIKYPFKRMVLPLFLGNLTLMILISWLAIQGVQVFG